MDNSSAALLRDGSVVAAVEEERFSRVKHDGGFPYGSIANVLNSQNLSLSDIDHVAVYWNPYKIGHRVRCVLESLMFNPKVFLVSLYKFSKLSDSLQNFLKRVYSHKERE